MQNVRRTYFPGDDLYVITGLIPTGEFAAFVEGEELVRGRGQTRLAAIADLNEAIAAVGSIYERDTEIPQLAAE